MTDAEMAAAIRAACTALNDLMWLAAEENGLAVKLDEIRFYTFGDKNETLRITPQIMKRV